MYDEYEYGWCPFCGDPESVCNGRCLTEMEEQFKEESIEIMELEDSEDLLYSVR